MNGKPAVTTKHNVKNSSIDLNQLRKDTRKEAVKKYIECNLCIYRNEINAGIAFTVKGIKEAINQPHPEYELKLEVIKNLEPIIKTAVYSGKQPNSKNKNKHITYFHYFDIIIGAIDSQIVISEDKWGKYVFYSITIQKKSGQAFT